MILSQCRGGGLPAHQVLRLLQARNVRNIDWSKVTFGTINWIKICYSPSGQTYPGAYRTRTWKKKKDRISSLSTFDEHHDPTGFFQRVDQFLERVRAHDVRALGAFAQELVDLFHGPVVGGDDEAVIVHVQYQVLAHDGQADEADVGSATDATNSRKNVVTRKTHSQTWALGRLKPKTKIIRFFFLKFRTYFALILRRSGVDGNTVTGWMGDAERRFNATDKTDQGPGRNTIIIGSAKVGRLVPGGAGGRRVRSATRSPLTRVWPQRAWEKRKKTDCNTVD